MAVYRYLVIVEKGENNYGAYSPDVLGCVSAGDTVEETLSHFREALQMHLEGTFEDDLPAPSATSVAAEFIQVGLSLAVQQRLCYGGAMMTKRQYIEYLISTPANYTCSNLAEHLEGVSHDTITDYLARSRLTARQPWELVAPPTGRQPSGLPDPRRQRASQTLLAPD